MHLTDEQIMMFIHRHKNMSGTMQTTSFKVDMITK
jgi:hypothetical protein